jgi:hypothetical protein
MKMVGIGFFSPHQNRVKANPPALPESCLTSRRLLAKDARFRGARPEWSRVGDPLEATQMVKTS